MIALVAEIEVAIRRAPAEMRAIAIVWSGAACDGFALAVSVMGGALSVVGAEGESVLDGGGVPAVAVDGGDVPCAELAGGDVPCAELAGGGVPGDRVDDGGVPTGAVDGVGAPRWFVVVSSSERPNSKTAHPVTTRTRAIKALVLLLAFRHRRSMLGNDIAFRAVCEVGSARRSSSTIALCDAPGAFRP
jgi:hypothetical protein